MPVSKKHLFKNIKNFLLLLVGSALLSSCSSCMLKEQCENINWFEHGKKISMSGKYIEDDEMVKKCKSVDVISYQQIDLGFKSGRDQYCMADQVVRTAMEGEILNYQMCDGIPKPALASKYAEGLKVLCTADGGYRFGLSGKVYKNTCINGAEAAFFPTYYKGRKEYLIKIIDTETQNSTTLSKDLASLEEQESRISSEVRSLPNAMDCSNKAVWDESLKRDVTKLVCQEAWYIKNQRDSLNSQMSRVRDQHNDTLNKWKRSQATIVDSKTELAKIP
jgi:hypothetical protein